MHFYIAHRTPTNAFRLAPCLSGTEQRTSKNTLIGILVEFQNELSVLKPKRVFPHYRIFTSLSSQSTAPLVKPQNCLDQNFQVRSHSVIMRV